MPVLVCCSQTRRSLELKIRVTAAVGSESRTTVKVAVPPASVVSPEMEPTVIPGVSSSRLVTATELGVMAA